MQKLQRDVISLISCAFNENAAFSSKDINWEEIYSIGKKHQILTILFYGIFNCKTEVPAEIKNSIEMTNLKAVSVNVNQLWEIGQINKAFNDGGIEFMPLKGTVLKTLYPHPEMRLMGDADILIKPEQYNKIRTIMQNLGFEEKYESDHELVWDKKGKLNVELHKRLIPSYNKDYYAYFGDGWRLALPSGEGTRYILSDEDQFVYIFTHFAKHYRDAGIGLRHILDIWVYLNAKPDLDIKYIKKELNKLQLGVFFNNIANMLNVWFDGKPDNEIADFITDRLFNSGIYGTYSNHIMSAALKESKNIGSESVQKKNLIKLIFLPYKNMCQKYEILKKIPVLLPFMWIVRWFSTCLFKRKSIKVQIGDLKLRSRENINSYQADLNFVGLDFNFKE